MNFPINFLCTELIIEQQYTLAREFRFRLVTFYYIESTTELYGSRTKDFGSYSKERIRDERGRGKIYPLFGSLFSFRLYWVVTPDSPLARWKCKTAKLSHSYIVRTGRTFNHKNNVALLLFSSLSSQMASFRICYIYIRFLKSSRL